MNDFVIAIGNFFFRHRNWAFPVLIVAIFAIAVPPSQILGSETLETVKDGLAVLLAVSGLLLRALVIGYRHVSRAGQKRSIHAAQLYTTELFALSRNPLYAGNVLILAGAFLMHGNGWTILVGMVVFVFIYSALIRAEEAYLHNTFGADYDAYRARVPRWIPNLFRLRDVTRGQHFDVRRVLIVEYTNVGVTALVLILAEMYEEIAKPISLGRQHAITVLAILLVLAVLWIVTMRTLKKRRIIVPAA